jgi:carbamoyltransferase
MKDKLILSAYGSHNAAIAMYYKGEYRVIEVERWLNSKNIGLTTYMPSKHPQLVFDEITEYLLSTTDRSDVDVYLTDYVQRIKPKFHIKESLGYDHHTAHAATAFYQSPYREALIFTFDGGGDNGYFNVYLANRTHGITLIDKFDQDLGFPYMIIGDYLADIKKEPLSIANLVYAGKIMGLCSYGVVRDEWVPHFQEFYAKFNYMGNSYMGGAEARYDALTALFQNIGLADFDFELSRYDGQISWDIAATSQKAFENEFFKFAQPYLDKYPALPVAMSGGCALNVLLNSKLLKLRDNKVFVPPNVNDCGIAAGGLLWYQNPEGQVDLTYSGTPILDKNQFGTYVQEHDLVVHDDVQIEELAQFIAEGNIVGMIQGNSEHGSRALGNRSIICNPVGDMKDVLNNKVKHREWYRPFAPMVRLEDTSKYFDFPVDVESRHMIFVADVKEYWRDKIPAITHEDNSARLQTVTRKQNPLIYDLLGELEKFTGHAVLLNTSFNVDGKPILSRLSDAFKILRDTQLDAVYFEGKIITKHTNDNFKKLKDIQEAQALTDDTSIYVLSFTDIETEIADDIKKIKELVRDGRNLTVLIPEYNYQKYSEQLPESESFKYFNITSKQHYYTSRLQSRFEFNSMSTVEYARYIKLFWCKEAIHANPYNSKYHLFVNLNEFKEHTYSYNVVRDVDLLSIFAKTDEHVVITSKKEIDSIFGKDYIAERFKSEVDHYPTAALFCGNIENLEWMFNNYEGMLLWYMDTGKIGKEHDYLLVSSIENLHRYKFLDA